MEGNTMQSPIIGISGNPEMSLVAIIIVILMVLIVACIKYNSLTKYKARYIVVYHPNNPNFVIKDIVVTNFIGMKVNVASDNLVPDMGGYVPKVSSRGYEVNFDLGSPCAISRIMITGKTMTELVGCSVQFYDGKSDERSVYRGQITSPLSSYVITGEYWPMNL